jgi:hypothetical protein
MKTMITAVLIGVASSQVQAEGFYQLVVGDRPQSTQVGVQNHGDESSPLYRTVTETSRAVAIGEIRTQSVVHKDDVTPLERQVFGS